MSVLYRCFVHFHPYTRQATPLGSLPLFQCTLVNQRPIKLNFGMFFKRLSYQGSKLRQIVDDRYTASVLLGLSQTFQNSLGENHNILSSANVCRRASDNSSVTVSTPGLNCNETNYGGNYVSETAQDTSDPVVVTKRVRRRGKYTPQERERIRFILTFSLTSSLTAFCL